MYWWYRLQQRLSITTAESTAVLVLAGLFLLGLGARTWQQRAVGVPSADYAELDSLFAAGLASVPGDTATARPSEAPLPPVPGGERLDLNRATAAELETLPRIGPKTAARILAYREAEGPFSRVDELLNVRGIGEKTLAQVEPYLEVR